MNSFDHALLEALNRIADASPLFTKAVVVVYMNPLKTAFIAALMWYSWFAHVDEARRREAHERLVACLLASVICILLVRLSVYVLPFRTRPIVNPAAGLHFPIDPGGWLDWSSFPSDNAIMFSMIATCLYTISRPIGVLAAMIVALLILFPRVFVGVHHPTDILAGVLIGVLAAWLAGIRSVRHRLAGPVLAFAQRKPALFAAAAFLLTFLIAETYWPATSLILHLRNGLRLMF